MIYPSSRVDLSTAVSRFSSLGCSHTIASGSTAHLLPMVGDPQTVPDQDHVKHCCNVSTIITPKSFAATVAPVPNTAGLSSIPSTQTKPRILANLSPIRSVITHYVPRNSVITPSMVWDYPEKSKDSMYEW